MTPARRELRLAVLLCLVGSGLVLLAVTRAWGDIASSRSLTINGVRDGISGDVVAGDIRALGFVGLAGVLAIAATKRWGRAVVGVVVALSGVAIVIRAASLLHGDLRLHLGTAHAGCGKGFCFASGDQLAVRTHLLWPWLTLLGGVVLAAAGLLVAARGRHWAALSSSYQIPSARDLPTEVTDKGTWDALDRGDDPTA